jgi:hypothetical protein
MSSYSQSIVSHHAIPRFHANIAASTNAANTVLPAMILQSPISILPAAPAVGEDAVPAPVPDGVEVEPSVPFASSFRAAVAHHSDASAVVAGSHWGCGGKRYVCALRED